MSDKQGKLRLAERVLCEARIKEVVNEDNFYRMMLKLAKDWVEEEQYSEAGRILECIPLSYIAETMGKQMVAEPEFGVALYQLAKGFVESGLVSFGVQYYKGREVAQA